MRISDWSSAVGSSDLRIPSVPRFHVVGRLLELDTLARQRRRRQPRLLAVDRERVAGSLPREARMLPGDRGAQQGEGRPRQHVAAVRSLVAEDAVVEQGVGPAVMNTKQRRPTSAIPGPVRLAEPDVPGPPRKADVPAAWAFPFQPRPPPDREER